MKHYLILMTIIILFIAGCSFTRQLKVSVDGAKAAQYGNVEEVLIQNNWELRLFQR